MTTSSIGVPPPLRSIITCPSNTGSNRCAGHYNHNNRKTQDFFLRSLIVCCGGGGQHSTTKSTATTKTKFEQQPVSIPALTSETHLSIRESSSSPTSLARELTLSALRLFEEEDQQRRRRQRQVRFQQEQQEEDQQQPSFFCVSDTRDPHQPEQVLSIDLTTTYISSCSSSEPSSKAGPAAGESSSSNSTESSSTTRDHYPPPPEILLLPSSSLVGVTLLPSERRKRSDRTTCNFRRPHRQRKKDYEDGDYYLDHLQYLCVHPIVSDIDKTHNREVLNTPTKSFSNVPIKYTIKKSKRKSNNMANEKGTREEGSKAEELEHVAQHPLKKQSIPQQQQVEGEQQEQEQVGIAQEVFDLSAAQQQHHRNTAVRASAGDIPIPTEISAAQQEKAQVDALRRRVDAVLRNMVQGEGGSGRQLGTDGSGSATVPITNVTRGGPAVVSEETLPSMEQLGEGSHWVVDPYGDQGQFHGQLDEESKLPHGSGKMEYVDGRVYDGEWNYGKWHGQGKAKFSNGDMFKGQYYHDQRHGYGEYKWSDGRVYKGEFVMDQRQGSGVYVWKDGARYKGEFSKGLRHGHGEYHFTDGSIYKGEWQRGKYHGQGECHWSDGRVYKGEWVNGQAHGKGKEIRPDGSIRHDGRWENDKPIRDAKKNVTAV